MFDSPTTNQRERDAMRTIRLASALRTAAHNDGLEHSVFGSSDPAMWIRLADTAFKTIAAIVLDGIE